MASESRMQRTTSAAERRAGLARGRGRSDGSAPACRRAGGTRSASTSTVGPPGGQPAAWASSSARSKGSPASAQVRNDSCSSHRPPTLRRKRTRPSTPPSLVKFAARLASVRTGSSSSKPDQRPGAGGDVGEVVGRWPAPPTTADAVSCEPTATTVTSGRNPVLAATSARSRAGHLTRRHQRRQPVGRDAEPVRAARVRPGPASGRPASRWSRRWSSRSAARRSASTPAGRAAA